MSCRPRSLTRLVLILSLPVLLLAGGEAHAHRLNAECFVRSGWRIQVEAWFETGEPPRGARVRVYLADGELLTEGKLDKQGIFIFTFTQAEPLRVVVSAGGGHRKEVTIAADALAKYAIPTCVACLTPQPSPFLIGPLLLPVTLSSDRIIANEGSLKQLHLAEDHEPLADRSGSFPITGVVAGLVILLTVAGFFAWRSRTSRRSDTGG
jgi:nickel transport protein